MITEAVLIDELHDAECMNNKREWTLCETVLNQETVARTLEKKVRYRSRRSRLSEEDARDEG